MSLDDVDVHCIPRYILNVWLYVRASGISCKYSGGRAWHAGRNAADFREVRNVGFFVADDGFSHQLDR